MKKSCILLVLVFLALLPLVGKAASKSPYPPKGYQASVATGCSQPPVALQLPSQSQVNPSTRNTVVFHETFETSSLTLPGWTQIYVEKTNNWSFNSGSTGGSVRTAYAGSRNARFTSTNRGPYITKLVSPALDLGAYDSGTLSFFYAQERSNQGQNELKLYYRTSSSSAWVQLAHYTQNVTSWTNVTMNLPNLSNGYQIAFEGIDNRGNGNVIDEVSISGIVNQPPIGSFPFLETFEEDSLTRNRWTQVIESGSTGWSFATGSSGGSVTQAHSGSLNARYSSSSGGPYLAKLISPVFDFSAQSHAELTFWYAQEAWSGDQNELTVYYRTGSSADWIQLAHYSDNISQWTEASLNLPNLSNSYQIAFEGVNRWGYANVLDDISVSAGTYVVDSFPFLETFEEDSLTRSKWSQIQESGNTFWSFATGSSGGSVTTAFEGTLNARYTSSGGGPYINKLISPIFDLSSLGNPVLSFMYAQEFWDPDQNELKLYYRINSDSPWQQFAHFSQDVPAWTKVTVGLPNPSSSYQIAFEGIDNYGHANVLDNIYIEHEISDPQLTISTDAMYFPLTATNEQQISILQISNSGGGILTMNSPPYLAGADAAQFHLIDTNDYPLNLLTGHEAQYQIVYQPRYSGNHRAELIVSYQNNPQIPLFGRAANLIYAEDFDTYADFSLDISPWTQYDGDASATYSIVDLSFTNQNYTGSFIVFNPNSTSPALGDNWQAHSGARYAAAFAAQNGPNNDWLISPAIHFGSEPSLSFMAKSITDQYGLERMKVMYSTTGNSPADFSNYLEGSSNSYTEVPTQWTPYVYDLPAECANTTVHIAIQCVSDDAFVLMIDSFRAFGDIYPAASFDPPAYSFPQKYPYFNLYQEFSINNTGEGVLRLLDGDIFITGDDEFSLYYVPQYPIEVLPGASASIIVEFYPTAPGSYSAVLNLTDNFGVHISAPLSATTMDNLITNFPHIQGFEGQDPAKGWMAMDLNGDGYAWELLYNEGSTIHAHTGRTCVISRSWVPDKSSVKPDSYNAKQVSETGYNPILEKSTESAKGPLSPDNWLITPPLQLGVNLELSWRISAHNASWPAEHYSVLISTTSPESDQFSPLFSETLTDANWQYRSLDLSEYSGETVYIAFRHHDCYDQHFIKLDDIKIFRINTDAQYGLVDDSAIEIEMDPITDLTQNIPLHVTIRGSGFDDGDLIFAQIEYANGDLGLPNSGLVCSFRNASFGNKHLQINHGLGFVPMQAFWRILPGDWNLLSQYSLGVSEWSDIAIAFTVPDIGKQDGAFQIVFPKTGEDTLPVTLTSFVATLAHNGRVKLNWVTASETNVLGYTVLRNETEDLANALSVSPLIEATNSSTEQVYEFNDREIQSQTRYYYWLISRDFDGAECTFGPVNIHTLGSDGQGDLIPKITKNLGNYPNPFNPSTTMRYSLAEAARVKLKIYNTKGQLMRSYEAQHNSPGFYKWIFDGKDDAGNDLTSGIYFYRFESGKHSSTHSMILMK